MERSPDIYLHKKFKKQLNIEQKPTQQQNDKENTDFFGVVEQSKEKSNETQMQREYDCHKHIKDNQSTDNKEIVPNLSTKQNSVSNASILARSSISTETCISVQSSTSCISNVTLNSHNEEQYKPASFDTTFSTNQMTNSAVSSTLVNIFSKQVGKEDISSSANDDLDLRDYKNDDVAPPPDRHSSGKYVCKYCNLVCSKPSVLQKHIRAHTNERPYPCNDCGFSFKTRSNLYKHCRSRTHANRVLGTKSQEGCSEGMHRSFENPAHNSDDNDAEKLSTLEYKSKPYKPRFHTEAQSSDSYSKENMDENSRHADSDILSHHINEIISKNNSILNPSDSSLRNKTNEPDNVNNNEYSRKYDCIYVPIEHKVCDEPLNLTKSRKRSMSEIGEPVAQKSLIKELLLKNLYSDMQCPYCKMIFQTVTELELHKLRSCKGKPSEVKYTRSSSVNVASILTKNKNAFDNLPQLQNTVFPLSSPGPFLGKTRLVESDKNKSFSFDGGNLPLASSTELSSGYLLSPLTFGKEKKASVKLFGGEVKVHSSGETKSYRIDGKEDSFQRDSEFVEFGGKVSENRVVKSSLQSGGTVLTNKPNFKKNDIKGPHNLIKVYENIAISPGISLTNLGKSQFSFDTLTEDKGKTVDLLLKPLSISTNPVRITALPVVSTSIVDFATKSVHIPSSRLLQSTPEQLLDHHSSDSKAEINNCNTSWVPRSPVSEIERRKGNYTKKQILLQRNLEIPTSPMESNNACNPVNLVVNGKIVRYVPGMPGPVIAESGLENVYARSIIAINKPIANNAPVMPPLFIDTMHPLEKMGSPQVSKIVPREFLTPPEKSERLNRSPKQDNLEAKSDLQGKPIDIRSPSKNEVGTPVKEQKSPSSSISEPKKFIRPNSLALKPTTAALKQHHGLTPTIFNQILISPDTPRVEKKYAQHFLHGNYFSYLGLKSSTKPVYCTLNKTQPFYVPHFKKLSMYSEWRQQDTKTDKLFVSSYDSRQKNQRFSIAGKPQANLIIHSSYKFKVSELPSQGDKNKADQKGGCVLGGYESNDDYTYIRGRGRGKYVCDQCGIRCKKPSMLKKHIRTHSNDRPYTCDHCNFSFKTKGNLTKHMKSKAHTKNYAASSSSGSYPITQSSDSETDDSGMDSSDESSTRHQEHEAAYGLLSLSQKTTKTETYPGQRDLTTTVFSSGTVASIICMTSEEIAHVSKTNYAKNKILDEKNLEYSTAKKLSEISESMHDEDSNSHNEYENRNIINYLGKANIIRPLTYPYTSPFTDNIEAKTPTQEPVDERPVRMTETPPYCANNSELIRPEPKSISKFHVIQKYGSSLLESQRSSNSKKEVSLNNGENTYAPDQQIYKGVNYISRMPVPTIKVNDITVQENFHENILDRKRKYIETENNGKKVQKNDEVMDLSMPTTVSKQTVRINGITDDLNNKLILYQQTRMDVDIYSKIPNIPHSSRSPQKFGISEEDMLYHKNEYNREVIKNGPVLLLRPMPAEDIQNNYTLIHEQHSNSSDHSNYDNSAMETLADVATKQVKLEKNTMAKSVASEYLKLATKTENFNGPEQRRVVLLNKDELLVKPEGNKNCTICSKTFSKPSQLRLHMNIHYLERPFRCDSCSVSFRTKGHLQKHERSAGHHSKLSSAPAQSSTEPRPFKCSDCKIAFRIHGHLAKHLRSKMHIMKLENLAKIPFGLYAELERSNSLLTEINTSDGDQCLESLKTLAKKVFVNDPNLQSVMNQVDIRQNDEDMDS